MKVCILSDSHDNIPLLDAAVGEACAAGAEAILHCGDVVAPSSLHCLLQHQIPVHVIHGNNTGDLYTLGMLAGKDNGIVYHGMDASLELAGRRIFLVHYPHYARAMALTGDWDLVCCGHSHKALQQQIASVSGESVWLINPGTVGGVGKAPATYVMADLQAMQFELVEVSSRTPLSA